MKLMTRNEIVKLLKFDNDFINDDEDFFQSDIDKEYSKDSHIQQCSVDLHIGKIYLPEVKEDEVGGCRNPITTEYILQTGQTGLVRTLEKIKLPGNISGICFSPSRITLKGVLITNMGHVDPGYEGCLHFTIINMGRSPFVLRKKDIIGTMLLIDLMQKTQLFGSEIFEDKNNEIPLSVSRNLPQLSKDFINVEKRARSIAKKEVNKAKIWSIGIPILVAVLAITPAIWQNFFSKPWEKQITEMQKEIEKIDYTQKVAEKLKTIDDIKRRIEHLEKIQPQKGK